MVRLPSPVWHVLQEIGVPAPFRAMCVACAPEMLGYAAPAGGPPSGGPAWQEVQVSDVSGDAATWHVWQAGPDFAVGAETSWQPPQFAGNVAAVSPKWVTLLNGTGCGAPPGPWHKVLLKQPAGVPAAAGVAG